jgi:glycosyltransferase involved in cell wall biosynthesis
MALFTIITINLNNREGLERTIKSVMTQSFKDVEYIVVDGQSTDGSLDVISNFREGIHQLIVEKDNGVYDAMNKGLRHATGQYIQFLNSGDELKGTNALQIISEKIPHSEILYTDVELFGGERESVKVHPDKLSLRYQLTDMVCHQAIFASSELFKKTGPFDASYKIYGDYDWLMRALRKHNARAIHLPLALVRYEEVGLSNTANKSLQLKEKDSIHDHYFPKWIIKVYRWYRARNEQKSLLSQN